MKSKSKIKFEKKSSNISSNEKINENKDQGKILPYFEQNINNNKEEQSKNKESLNNIEKLDNTQKENLKNKSLINNEMLINSSNEDNNSIEDKSRNKNVLITQIKNERKYKKLKLKQNYDNDKNSRTLEDLKEQKKKLKKKMKELEENKSTIEKESLINLTLIEQNIKRDKLKEIESKTIDTNDKIKKVNYLIKSISDTENYKNTKNEKIKNFLDNFEKEKEIVESRAKKYSEESKKIKEKMKRDIESIINKRKKEIDLKEEEEKKQSFENLKKLKERDKETRLNIEKIKEEKYKGLKVKEHIKNKINFDEKDYLFSQLKEKFLQEEEDYIKTQNIKRKYLMRSIPLEEIREFQNQYLENKLKFKKVLEEKTEYFKRELNHNYIPNYISHFREISELNSNRLKLEKENKEKKIEEQLQAKKDYSLKILNKKPKISLKLKQEREENISKLTERKIIRDTLYNHKKNRIILKKRDPNKPLKYNWELKLDKTDFDNSLNNSIEIEKPIKISLSQSISLRKENLKNNKVKDYLSLLKKEREEKKNKLQNDGKNDNKNWDKIINSSNGNYYEKVNQIKLKAYNLTKDADKKDKLLKKKGGIEKNPQLGQNIAYLLIDSIEAKLSILNTVEN